MFGTMGTISDQDFSSFYYKRSHLGIIGGEMTAMMGGVPAFYPASDDTRGYDNVV